MLDDNDQRPLPESPYKFLSFYDTSDAASFFGRDEEIRAVGDMVSEFRLSVLYGASGAGKTSLLLAGVLPFLGRTDHPHLPIYARLLGEPDAILRREVQRAVRNRLPVLSSPGVTASGVIGHLRGLIVDHFTLAEINLLCKDLSIRYEDLPGDTISMKANELIDFCYRHHRLAVLLNRCRELRPTRGRWLGDLPPERFPLLVNFEQAQTGPLIPFLSDAAALLDANLVLIIDQFEEFMQRGEKDRQDFIDLLADLHDAQAAPVHVLLSLREDWLAHIDEIEVRVPALAGRQRRKRLLPLSRSNARDAILGPLQDSPYRFQDGLVERLLDDLIDPAETRVMPVQLQIVCSALFDRMVAAGRQEMRLDDYQELGGAESILSQHFSRVLSAFPPEQGVIAGLVLDELISSKGTRVVKSMDELAAALSLDPGVLRPVLERLLQARMVHDVGKEEGQMTKYELAHEYLIRDFQLGQATRERKRMEEMVRRELEDWGDKKTLISAEKMRLINRQRDLLHLPPAADELLFRSALETGEDPLFWLKRLKDEKNLNTILLAAVTAEDDAKRQRAAFCLIEVAPDTVDAALLVAALVQIALTDSSKDNRRVAEEGLAELADGDCQEIVTGAVEDAATLAGTGFKASNTYTDLLGKLNMPLGLRPAAIRYPRLTPWLIKWTTSSLAGAVLMFISLVMIMLAVERILANLFKAPELSQATAFGHIAIGMIGFFAGAGSSGAQRNNLRNFLPSPPRRWQEISSLAWLLGALLAIVLIEDVGWPASLTEQGFGYVVPIVAAALSLLLVVVTAQWLALRRSRFRFSPLPLWGWSLALMIPLIAALALTTLLATNFGLLFIVAALAFLYGITLPSLAVGLWLVLLARKESFLRPATSDAS